MESSNINIYTMDYKTANIGDLIQTIATVQYFPRIDSLYERDNGVIEKKNSVLIFNAWITNFMKFNKLNNVDNLKIISVHLGNYFKRDKSGKSDPVNGKVPDFLPQLNDLIKLNKRIGCRDVYSYNYLKENSNIDCYLSYCNTLSLESNKPINKREGYTMCDTNKYPLINKYLPNNIIKNAKYTIHEDPRFRNNDFKTNIKEAIKLLDLYRNSELVITTRLHVALPCLAFDTPVIFIANKDDKRLKDTYIDLFEYFIDYREISKLENINYKSIKPKEKSDKLKKIIKNTDDEIKTFLKSINIDFIKTNYDDIINKYRF